MFSRVALLNSADSFCVFSTEAVEKMFTAVTGSPITGLTSVTSGENHFTRSSFGSRWLHTISEGTQNIKPYENKIDRATRVLTISANLKRRTAKFRETICAKERKSPRWWGEGIKLFFFLPFVGEYYNFFFFFERKKIRTREVNFVHNPFPRRINTDVASLTHRSLGRFNVMLPSLVASPKRQ